MAEVGAIATQAEANVAYKGQRTLPPRQRRDCAGGAPAAVGGGPRPRRPSGRHRRQRRQRGLPHRPDCLDWAGGLTGDGYAIQGNILVGEEVIEAMRTAWEETADHARLARRLLAALQAGDAAGGDSRGRQSAALFVVKDGAGYDGRDDVAVDLRVDDHEDPCAELERLLDLNERYLTAPDEEDRTPLDDELRAELEAYAQRQGKDSFDAWVGAENLEMRVGEDWVDQQIIDIVRRDQ